jgi:hypothetical protein
MAFTSLLQQRGCFVVRRTAVFSSGRRVPVVMLHCLVGVVGVFTLAVVQCAVRFADGGVWLLQRSMMQCLCLLAVLCSCDPPSN